MYFTIIESARLSPSTGYRERHHVVPHSLGGSNGKVNIIELSARQHFVCHLLLVRMTSGRNHFKMVCAAHHMAVCHHKERYRVTSRTYEALKRQRSESMRGELNPMYGKSPTWTDESRQKLSLSLRSSEAFKTSRGPAWKRRISEAQSQGVVVVNSLTGAVFGEWPNCSHVAEALGCTRANVKAAVRNKTCIGRKLASLDHVPHFVRWKQP